MHEIYHTLYFVRACRDLAFCRRFPVSWATSKSSDMGASSFYIDSDYLCRIHFSQSCDRRVVCGRLAFESRRHSARAVSEAILFRRSFLFIDQRVYLLCQQIRSWIFSRLTPRWSQRRLPLEFMDGLSYTMIIELAEPLARRRGSALDR